MAIFANYDVLAEKNPSTQNFVINYRRAFLRLGIDMLTAKALQGPLHGSHPGF